MNIRKVFRILCHQIPERCYFFCGEPLLVCARCLGIYAGFLIGFFWLFAVHGIPKMGMRLFWTGLFFVPMAIDGTTQIFRMRKSNNTLRFVSGYLAGTGTAILTYVAFGITFFTAEIAAMLPSFESLAAVVFMFPLLYLLEKYQSRNTRALKRIFNGLCMLSTVVLVGGISFLYAVALYGAIFK